MVGRVVAMQRPQHEDVAQRQHDDIRGRESQGAVLECLGDRRRQHQAGEHQREKHDPHRGLLGVEPIGDPGGVNPRPPHREQQDGGLQRTDWRQMFEQAMGKLCHRKDEHQIEKQFDEGDAVVLVAVSDRRWLVRAAIIPDG